MKKLPASHPEVQAAFRARGHKHAVARAKRTRGARGYFFDSKTEARFSYELEQQRQAGLIHDWIPHVSLVVGLDEGGRKVRYTADFLTITIDGENKVLDWIEVKPKGGRVDSNRDKRAALRVRGIEVRVVRR